MIDEDSFVIPESWRAVLRPRRGGVPGPQIEPDAEAVALARQMIEEARPRIDAVLAHPGSERSIAEAAGLHLGGVPDPLGAAAVTVLVCRQAAAGLDEDIWRLSADAWVTEHGLPFAAEAFAAAGGLRAWSAGEPETLRFLTPSDGPFYLYWHGRQVAADRIRALLAAAGDAKHREAVERLAGHRRTPQQRIIVSFLAPDRQDWVDECCADPPPDDDELRRLLWCSLGRADQVAALGHLGWSECRLPVLATLAEGIGPAIAPVLADYLDRAPGVGPNRSAALEVLAALPTDEAFELLLERTAQKQVHRALMEAARRFPVRTLRLLGPRAADDDSAAELVDTLLHERPDLVDAALPHLPREARQAVEASRARRERVPDASAEELPSFLVDPPWLRRRREARPPVVDGLTVPGDCAVVWAPGEREEWLTSSGTGLDLDDDRPRPEEIEELLAGRMPEDAGPTLLLRCSRELMGPVLREYVPPETKIWGYADWTRSIVARYETDALPLALAVARLNSTRFTGVLLPFRHAEVARLMADRLSRGRAARQMAAGWFARHGTRAVPPLVPAALGRPGRERRDAEAALRLLASQHGADEVTRAAGTHGRAAAEAVAVLLAADPLEVLPARPPKIGAWADPADLPQVLLRDRRRALPDTAVRHLVTMLAMSKPDAPYAGVPLVKELCDPESLAEFGWALFRRWEGSDAAPGDEWALTQLSWTGDDRVVRRLPAVIRPWPDLGLRRLAVLGLDVLADIGTPEALARLHAIGHRLRFGEAKAPAREKARELAETLGLTPEQVADRLTPDLGLDADGTVTLDYGARRFVMGFDDRLTPYVEDEQGRRRKALPKPAAKDDPERAAAAKQRFAELRKGARDLVAEQLARLENAMLTGRRWTPEEFDGLLVRHPLLRHLARRLLWTSEAPDGASTAFRIAEDGTFADVDDETFTPPEGAHIALAHPARLGASLKAWLETFEDYQIIQPFPQLTRPVHTLAETGRATGVVELLRGRHVPRGREELLTRRGWRYDGREDGRFALPPTSGGHYVIVDLDTLVIGHIDLTAHPVHGPRPGFGPLDPTTLSELVTDLLKASTPA
ncbi:DUF4132 domain-containing protein [Thermomonospora cellulosilytica]|uniref:DUF4132 domain-containing protein n=1 Tax=Thermomonospora cellulosilytica TaxID=1411118 RepID=A0A7W3R615_9ACTN|nr:DUF4132 domain-containing protein [Thermomonospora cellulosilytica]MBA9001678.1 hypothetical protein [Thermomonospora cellulosilytica]